MSSLTDKSRALLESFSAIVGRVYTALGKKGHAAELVRGAGAAFLIKMLGMVATFGCHILLARCLGADSYGVYVVVLSWVLLLSTFSLFGFRPASLRFIAKYNAEKDWPRLRGFMQCSRRIVFFVSILMSIAMVIFAVVGKNQLDSEFFVTLRIGAGLLVFLTLFILTSSQLQGLKHIVASLAPAGVLKPVLMIAGIGLIVWLHPTRLSASTAMTVNLAITGLLFYGSLLWLTHVRPKDVRSAVPVYETSSWVRVAFSLVLVGSLAAISRRTDLLMIGAMRSTTEAGVYSAASAGTALMTFGLMATNAVVAPMISELYSAKRNKALRKMVRLANLCVLVYTVPAFLAAVVFGEWALSFFGPEFTVAYWPFIILCFSQVVNALVGPVSFLMTMTHHEKEAARILAVAVLVNIVLNAALIPFFGIFGAAVATATSTIVKNVSMLVYVVCKMGINPTVFPLGLRAR